MNRPRIVSRVRGVSVQGRVGCTIIDAAFAGSDSNRKQLAWGARINWQSCAQARHEPRWRTDLSGDQWIEGEADRRLIMRTLNPAGARAGRSRERNRTMFGTRTESRRHVRSRYWRRAATRPRYRHRRADAARRPDWAWNDKQLRQSRDAFRAHCRDHYRVPAWHRHHSDPAPRSMHSTKALLTLSCN